MNFVLCGFGLFEKLIVFISDLSLKQSITYIKAFRVFLAVCFGDTFILYGFEDTWHGRDQGKRNTRVFIRFENHHFFGSLLMSDHSQCGFWVFVIDGIINCRHFHIIIQKFAIHWQQQRNGIRFIFLSCQM